MKYIVVFVLALIALAAAAPQLIYPGVVGTFPTTIGARTVVAGPTVVNPGLTWPGRVFTTGLTTTGLTGIVPTYI